METGAAHEDSRLRGTLVVMATLFFAWGFITSTIDPLIPAVRAIFSLNYAECC